MPKRESLLDDDDVGHLGIKVNKEYAARFEHNKEREELHKLQARHPEMAARIARQSSRVSSMMLITCTLRAADDE